MNRVTAALGSIAFFFLAPGTVAGLVPWWISGWETHAGFAGAEVLRLVGVALIAAGLIVLIDSFRRFAVDGLGTPAPVLPTKHLVVTGLYQHVRNPMYVAVVALILGQALLFSDWRLLAYAAAVWLGFQAFVTIYEEPTLRQTFGEDYEVYCRNVQRWWPRLSPWRAQS
jgi:protein-S-isoprenylcysteine O-methyltransferase Ste14